MDILYISFYSLIFFFHSHDVWRTFLLISHTERQCAVIRPVGVFQMVRIYPGFIQRNGIAKLQGVYMLVLLGLFKLLSKMVIQFSFSWLYIDKPNIFFKFFLFHFPFLSVIFLNALSAFLLGVFSYDFVVLSVF